jgi:uncharacterized coiled-coil protein SlyX
MNNNDLPNTPQACDRLDRRLVAVEESLMHLERIVQELNSVVLAQQQRLDRLELRHDRLASELQGVVDRGAEPRRLEDDKPPHY